MRISREEAAGLSGVGHIGIDSGVGKQPGGPRSNINISWQKPATNRAQIGEFFLSLNKGSPDYEESVYAVEMGNVEGVSMRNDPVFI